MARKALPPTAAQEAERAAHRAEGRHAAPAHRPEHAAAGPVKRWYYILSHRGVSGHPQGARAELELTDGQASALMAAGHIAPADAPAVTEAPAPVVPEQSEDTGATPDDNDADNSAE